MIYVNHFALFLGCIFSIEIIFRFKFALILKSNLKFSKKAAYIILNKNISDHWKEKIIPAYALNIMKLSVQIFLILSCIILYFTVIDLFLIGFFKFIFSTIGIIESIIVGLGYSYFRRYLRHE